MKKAILLGGLSLMLITGCKNEKDLSPLLGVWDSTAITLDVRPDDPVIRNAITREVKRIFDRSVLHFEAGGEFQEYRYEGGRRMSMSSGTYFYNNGYKARYVISELFRITVLDLELRGDDELICRADLTKGFEDPGYLEQIGIENPKDHPIERVALRVDYKRTDAIPD